MSSKPMLQGSFILLWAGEDPDLHANLPEQLQAADIPCSDKTLGNDEVAPTADPLAIDWKPRFGFEVAVQCCPIKSRIGSIGCRARHP
jgi:hypothetical protein